MISIEKFRSVKPRVWRHARNNVPNLQFLSLTFFLYIIAAANIDGTIISNKPYQVMIGVAVFGSVAIQLVNWKQNYKLSAMIDSYLAFFTAFCVAIGFLLYLLGIGVDSFSPYEYLQWMAPTTCFSLFYLLTHNNPIQSNKWLPMGIGISKYALEKKVIAILPLWKGERFMYKYIYPTNINEISLLNGVSNDKTKLANSSFFFLKDDLSNSHKHCFQVPTESTYQSLDSKQNLTIPLGLPDLESNTSTHLFLARFFSNYSEQNNKVYYDLKLWLDDHEAKIIVFQSDEEKGEEITVFNKWTPMQLRIAASRIIESYIEPKPSVELVRIKLLFSENLSYLPSKNYDHHDAPLMFISILSLYDNDIYFRQERWNGIMTTFASATTIIQHLSEAENNSVNSHAESFHGGISNSFEDYTKRIIRINRNPVEEFVKVHDSIVQLAGNDPDFLSYFNQIIHTLMDELQRTKYKRGLIIKGKYTSTELTEMRKGLVAGTALSLSLLRDKMEVKS